MKITKELKKTFRAGDKIILHDSFGNLNQSWNNIPLEITRKNIYNYSVKSISGTPNGTISVYWGGQGYSEYDFSPYDRKDHAKMIKETIVKIKEDIKKMENEAILLEKYDTDEEEVAHNIHKMMKAKTPEAITEILKIMKKSNYI